MDGRHCTACGRGKSADAFEKNGRMPDGSVRLRSICKSCGSRNKKTRTDDRTCTKCGEHKKAEKFQGRRSDCRECQNEKTYEYRRGPGRAAHNARMVAYNKRRYTGDPEYRKKHNARQAVIRAVKKGMPRPTHCPRCKRKAVVHGHHHNGYEKEHWLDVVWLCARCHYKEDNP